MNKRGKIVFLSSKTRYLEHDLYIQLARTFPENLKIIYFESDFEPEINFNSSPELDQKQKEVAFNDYIKIAPVSLDKRILVNLKTKLIRILSNYQKIVAWKNEFLSTIDKIDPDAIVFISHSEFNIKLVRAFRKKITKLFLQPSNMRKNVRIERSVLFFMKKFIFHKIMKLPFFSSNSSILNEDGDIFYLLWSRIWVSHIKKKQNNKFIFVGAPKYDKYFQSFEIEKLIPSSPSIAIFLNKEMRLGVTNWNIFADFYKEIIRSFPSYNFIFKAHPLGNLDNCINSFPTNYVTNEPFPIEQADIVLTHWSNICYESISKGIPTILINPKAKFDFSEFHLQNYPAIVTNIEEFTRVLKNFKDSNNSKFPQYRNIFIKEQIFSADGKSSERTVQAIKEILSKK